MTRYRLVFTPDAGLLCPPVLPGFTQVGNSAVYFVYLPAPATTKQATFTAWQPAGAYSQWENVWSHDYTITVNADRTFTGTGVQNGNDGVTTFENEAETITGKINADNTISYTAVRADGVTWTLTNAPTVSGLSDPKTANQGDTKSIDDFPDVEFRISAPQFVTTP